MRCCFLTASVSEPDLSARVLLAESIREGLAVRIMHDSTSSGSQTWLLGVH